MAPSVDSYYDSIHRATWTRRTAGFIGGTALGGAIGAPIGAAAAFIPYAFGAAGIAGAAVVAAPAMGAVITSAAMFAGVAGLMGFAAVGTVGADAGAMAAGLAEKEKLEGKTSTEAQSPAKPEKLFSWKVAAFTIPIFAAFGAVLALNPITAPAVVAAFGFAGGTTAAIAASASVLGAFGAVVGFKMSYLTNKVSNFFCDLITEKCFEKKPGLSAQPDITPVQEQHVPEHAPENEPRKSYTKDEKRFSVGKLAAREEQATPDMAWSRN